MSAAEAARALGGRQVSGERFLCRCPVPHHGRGLGDRSASLSLMDGETRLLVRCFAGCDARDVLAALRHLGLLDHTRPMPQMDCHRVGTWTPKPDETALDVWHAAAPPFGTIVERYLREYRGIRI